MKKRVTFLLLCGLLLGCYQTPVQTIQDVFYETTETSLHAVITSDTHYVHESNGADALIPLIGYSDDFMECLTAQVQDLHPDVFLITGDITNNGKRVDIIRMSEHLRKLKEDGISLILIPGNHDYDNHCMDLFEEYFYPLLSIQSKDSKSLSYTSVICDTCFVCMDDSYASDGAIGSFCTETMQWLEAQLETAKENKQKIVFVSHHSVLFSDSDPGQRYTITNTDLISLLEQYSVQMCFSGHQHSQSLLHRNNMYEVISAMPQTGSHIMGNLQIEGNTVTYQTIDVDFESYANETILSLLQNEQQSDRFLAMFSQEDNQEELLRLFLYFLSCAQNGVLINHVEEIRNDPYYDQLLIALQQTNYGPWMNALMENPPLDASYLQFEWN